MYLKDVLLINNLKKDGIFIDVEKFSLVIEKDYLNEEEIKGLIKDIKENFHILEEKYKMKFHKTFYNNKNPKFFIHSKSIPSHLVGGYENKNLKLPYILISYYKERKAPILHEMVHLLLEDSKKLFLREGIAIFFEKKYANKNSYPFNCEVDFKNDILNISCEEIYDQFMLNKYSNKKQFYISSFLFCSWLIDVRGIEKFNIFYKKGIEYCKEIYDEEFREILMIWYEQLNTNTINLYL